MFNVCYACGMYRVDKEIEPADSTGFSWAICPECGHKHEFIQLPVMFVCGPSCAGKSTVAQALMGNFDAAVVLDGDILWRDEFVSEENGGVKGFFDTWLRVAKNVGQAGKPVVIFNAGMIPDNMIENSEACYFSSMHFLALVCEGDELERRLKARPAWRGTHDPAFINQQIEFNNWIVENSQKDGRNITLIDSSSIDESATITQVSDWIRACVDNS